MHRSSLHRGRSWIYRVMSSDIYEIDVQTTDTDCQFADGAHRMLRNNGPLLLSVSLCCSSVDLVWKVGTRNGRVGCEVGIGDKVYIGGLHVHVVYTRCSDKLGTLFLSSLSQSQNNRFQYFFGTESWGNVTPEWMNEWVCVRPLL